MGARCGTALGMMTGVVCVFLALGFLFSLATIRPQREYPEEPNPKHEDTDDNRGNDQSSTTLPIVLALPTVFGPSPDYHDYGHNYGHNHQCAETNSHEVHHPSGMVAPGTARCNPAIGTDGVSRLPAAPLRCASYGTVPAGITIIRTDTAVGGKRTWHAKTKSS